MNIENVWRLDPLATSANIIGDDEEKATISYLQAVLAEDRGTNIYTASHVMKYPDNLWLESLDPSPRKTGDEEPRLPPIFKFHEIADTLARGHDAQVGTNWFQRLVWSARQVIQQISLTTQFHRRHILLKESYFHTEVSLFHQSAKYLGSLLASSLLGEVMSSPKLLDFSILTPERSSDAHMMHCPMFSDDRLFVKDSICFTAIRGGGISWRYNGSLCTSFSRVSKSSAVRCYKNEVTASEHYTNAIFGFQPPLYFAPKICGMLKWAGIAIFYEPLVIPLNIPLKAGLSSILESSLAWWRTRLNFAKEDDNTYIETPWYTTSNHCPLEWFLDGRVESLTKQDPLMAEVFKSLAQKLNTQVYGVPIGGSDIMSFLAESDSFVREDNHLTSIEPAIYWSHLEGENGLLHMRCLMECLPPLAMSPLINMGIRGEKQQETLFFDPTSAFSDLIKRSDFLRAQCMTRGASQEHHSVTDIPSQLLRRIPADLMMYLADRPFDQPQASIGPFFSTFYQWNASGNPSCVTSNNEILINDIKTWLHALVVDGYHGPAHSARLLKEWTKGLGQSTREFYTYIWSNPCSPAYMTNAVERDMVAKAVKRLFEKGLEVERLEEINRSTFRVRDVLNMPLSRRNLLVSLVVSRNTGVVNRLDEWTHNFVQRIFATGERHTRHFWDSAVLQEFESLYGSSLGTESMMRSFVAKMSPQHFLESFCMMSGVRCRWSTTENRIMIGSERATFEVLWAQRMISQYFNELKDRGSTKSPSLMQTDLREKALNGLTLVYSIPKFYEARPFATPALRCCLNRIKEYQLRRARTSDLNSLRMEANSCSFRNIICRDLVMSQGVFALMHSTMTRKAFPCAPMCLPDQPSLKRKSEYKPSGSDDRKDEIFDARQQECGRYKTVKQAFDAALLLLRSMGNWSPNGTKWKQLCLYYAYVALQHNHLEESYILAKSVHAIPTDEPGLRVEAELLLYQLMIQKVIPVDHVLAAHALLRQEFAARTALVDVNDTIMDLETELPVPPLYRGEQTGWKLLSCVIDELLLCVLLRAIWRIPNRKRGTHHTQYRLFISLSVRIADRGLTNARSALTSASEYGVHWVELVCLRARTVMYQVLAMSGLPQCWAKMLLSKEEFVRLAEKSLFMPRHAYAVELLEYAQSKFQQTKADLLPDDVQEEPYVMEMETIGNRDIPQRNQPRFLPALAWLATMLLEQSFGILNIRVIAGLSLTGDCLIASGLAGMQRLDRGHSDFRSLREYMQQATYQPVLTERVRNAYRDMLRVWEDPRRKRRFKLAIGCFEKAYLRLAARLNSSGLQERIYYKQETDPMHVTEWNNGPPGEEVWSIPICKSQEESWQELIEKIIYVTQRLLLAKALCLTHREEMGFLQQIVTAMCDDSSKVEVLLDRRKFERRRTKEYGPFISGDLPRSNDVPRVNFRTSSVSNFHESFHQLRLDLGSWSAEEEAHFQGVLLQVLAWGLPEIVKILPGCPQYIKQHSDIHLFFDRSTIVPVPEQQLCCRTPSTWFDSEIVHKAINWVASSGQTKEASSYPVPHDEWTSAHARKSLTLLIKRSHAAPDMQAKWLFHYIATIKGAAEGQEENRRTLNDSAADVYERFSDPLCHSNIHEHNFSITQRPSEVKLSFPSFWHSETLKGDATSQLGQDDLLLPVCSRPAYRVLPVADSLAATTDFIFPG